MKGRKKGAVADQILDILKQRAADGLTSPTCRELQALLGFSTQDALRRHLRTLREYGRITWSRAIPVVRLVEVKGNPPSIRELVIDNYRAEAERKWEQPGYAEHQMAVQKESQMRSLKLITCECGEEARVKPGTTSCKRCRNRALSRQWRKRNYHEVVKRNPALLAQHRSLSARGMQGVRDRRKQG